MKLKYLLPAALLMLAGTGARAIKAYPGAVTHVQPDGSKVILYLKGDENAHSFVTEDGFLVSIAEDGAARYTTSKAGEAPMVSDLALRTAGETAWLEQYGSRDLDKDLMKKRAESPRQQKIGIGTFPSKGNLKGIVLLVEFADNEFCDKFTLQYAQNKMNKEGFDEYGATGSVRDYFVAQSSGAFTPEFDVIGPIKLSEKLDYYGRNDGAGNDSHAGDMVKEACEIAQRDFGVDFSKYDYNDDGDVDFVYVIYAGYAESYGASSNTIWPHSSNLSRQYIDCNLDGKRIDLYACSSELQNTSGTTLEGIGPFVHEFSHVLGLPDIYNTSSVATTQLGTWDVMDVGPYNNSCHTPPNYGSYERYMVGWLEFNELTEPNYDVVCPEMSANNFAYLIQTGVENDVYTIENRQKAGWDKYHEGTGLMILHVYYVPEIWERNMVNVNYSYYNLMEADGSQGVQLETDLYPIPGNDMFTYFSAPAMTTCYGDPVDKGISKIRDEDGVIHFRFMKDRMHAPSYLNAENITSKSFTAVWEAVEDATRYDMKIREILPDEINPLLMAEEFAGMKYGSLSKPDYEDISGKLDEFMTLPGWTGSNIYSAGENVMIGKFNQSGVLTSPKFESNESTLTLAFSYKGYTGKRANCKVLVKNAAGKTIAKDSFEAGKDMTDLVLTFAPPAGGFTIQVESDSERCLMSRMRIVKGEVIDEELWSCGPKKWEINDIADSRYTVDGLAPDREYACSLRAMNDEEYRTSGMSEEFIVRTAEDTGVENIATEGNGTSIYYDLTGRRVDHRATGILIERTTDATGKVTVRKIVRRR